MKTASTELFDLINSLTINEKAYFKRYAALHKGTDKAYFKLFEVIVAQSEYCEEKVKEELKNEKMVSYFPRAKKYLYNKILESMRIYNADKNIEARLWRKYEDALFLHSRKQDKSAVRLLKKILKEGEKAECWTLCIKAFYLKVKITGSSGEVEKALDDWISVLNDNLAKIRDKYYFMLMDHGMGLVWYKKHGDNKRAIFESFRMKYLQSNEESISPTTTQGKIFYNRACSILHKSLKEFDLFYEKMVEAVSLFDENPILLQQRPKDYYNALQTLITADYDRFDKLSAKHHIQKLEKYVFSQKSIVAKNESLKVDYHPHFYFTLLVYQFKFGLHKEALQTVQKAKKTLKTYPNTYTINKLLLHNLFYLTYLINGQMEEALSCIQYILSFSNKHHKYLYLSALYWQLFIHIDLHNYQLLEYMLRNTIRAWKQEGIFSVRFQELCKFIQKQIHHPYPEFWQDISEWALEDGKISKYQGVDTLYAFAESRRQERSMEVVRRELIDQYVQKRKANTKIT